MERRSLNIRLFFVFLSVLLTLSCSAQVRYSSRGVVNYKARDRAQHFYVGQEWIGVSSYYGKKFHGRKTASGEIFDMYKMTAAHRTLPLGSVIRVTNLQNGKSVVVKVNDRGPFKKGRILDLSFGAAQKIGLIRSGTAKVKIKLLKLPAS